MGKLNKLTITDSLPMGTGKHYALRLREDLDEWINENAKGSYNSILNFLINIGINQIEGILEHDTLYQQVNEDEEES